MYFTQKMVAAAMSSDYHLNKIGPGVRSVLTLHRRIYDAANRDTPGAQRMRRVIGIRIANWRKEGETT